MRFSRFCGSENSIMGGMIKIKRHYFVLMMLAAAITSLIYEFNDEGIGTLSSGIAITSFFFILAYYGILKSVKILPVKYNFETKLGVATVSFIIMVLPLVIFLDNYVYKISVVEGFIFGMLTAAVVSAIK